MKGDETYNLAQRMARLQDNLAEAQAEAKVLKKEREALVEELKEYGIDDVRNLNKEIKRLTKKHDKLFAELEPEIEELENEFENLST